MNLENCRYYRLWQPAATLDSTKKNCCWLFHRRRGTQEQSELLRRIQQCSSSFSCHQGHAAYAVAGFLTSGLESKNSQWRLRFVC